jgi:hypothetical protein
MKLPLALLFPLAVSAGLAAPPAAGVNGANAHAEVVFLEPAKFTDVKDRDFGDYETTTYLENLRDHVLDRAKHAIPAGHKLAVTFTDIDMAGDFEPWRGPRFGDIRIVKDIYPPRIGLSFQLVDAAGHVVKSGSRELRDLAFLMKIPMGFRDDPMRHEKGLIDDWLRQEFPRAAQR